VYGGTIPALIWHDFMAGATWRMPVQDFTTPSIPRPAYNSYTTTSG
jgi:hypothetical protein